MAEILDGKKLSIEMNDELKDEILNWISNNHRRPQLTCVLVGSDPASAKYVENKMKAAKVVGLDSVTLNLDESITQSELLKKIHELNNDPNVDGVLVQLPLPESIDERTICNAVSPSKDVDGFHIENVGKFCLDMDAFFPCTPLGIREIIKRHNIDTFGKNVVVVGRSKNVGMPMAMLLHTDERHDSKMGMDATVTICHRYTPPEQLSLHCRNADIIVAAAGVPHLIKGSMIKPGATVIDVGLSRIKCPDTGNNKLVGDVDFAEVSKVAGKITPVPGGVGPMTVAMLMRNTFKAAKLLAKA